MRPAEALYQWEIEHAALIQCARAIAVIYGDVECPDAPEQQGLWHALQATYDALGVLNAEDLASVDRAPKPCAPIPCPSPTSADQHVEHVGPIHADGCAGPYWADEAAECACGALNRWHEVWGAASDA